VSEEVPVGWDATSDVSVGVTLTTGQNLTGIDFLNAQQGGQPEPTPTPGTTTTTPTTLPHTGMNQVPMSVTAGLSILLGLAMLIAGIVRRRQQQLLLARTSATVSGREWK
jgi:LPXTG-motif cell wall-anchored protein